MSDFAPKSRDMPRPSGALLCIGETPLVPLLNLHTGPGEVFAKAEYLQPGGSVKDRAALKAVELAYRSGDLIPGQTVIEMTSGNMGAGLAVVCNALGHPFIAVISEGNSPERVTMMRALGADVVIVPQVDGCFGEVTGQDLQAVEARARILANNCDGYYVDQFNNPGTVLAHEHGTGPEIWRQCGGKLDAFVACVGSGGTFVGTSRFLKSVNPDILCFAVEPKNVSVLTGNEPEMFTHKVQGTGYGHIPPQFDLSLMDGVQLVNDADAELWRKKLAKEEGLHVGFSAAANVCAASRLANSMELERPARIATILCDSGFKYS